MKRKLDNSLIMALAILVVVVVGFEILTNGKMLQARNLKNILNQSLTTMIAGLGMIVVVSFGGTNITAGVVGALAGIYGAMVASKTFLLAFPVAIAIGIVFGLFLGIVNARFKVPSFMVSLSILIAGRAAINWILEDSVIFSTPQILALDTFQYKIPILILLVLGIGYLLEYTPFGNYLKAVGENENAAIHIGIDVKKVKIWGFVISGIMYGIAGIFMIARSGGASNTMGTGMEMQVMMALFIGGIPVDGGTGSKIYKLVLGAPLIVLLENGLILCDSSGPITQLIRGIALLAIVYLSMILNKRDSGKGARKAKVSAEAA